MGEGIVPDLSVLLALKDGRNKLVESPGAAAVSKAGVSAPG